MEKIFFNISFTPSSKLKLLLNIFSYLSKNGKYSILAHRITNASQKKFLKDH